MTRSVVLFEDHTLENFRPLALSLPIYEMRIGVFSLRERVELVLKDLNPNSAKGTLLARDILAPLHTCEGWSINPGRWNTSQNDQGRFLWLNGRCAADFSELSKLINGEDENSGFVYFDEYGLVAADLSAEKSAALWQSWFDWSSGEEGPTGHWDCTTLKSKKMPTSIDLTALGHVWDIVPATPDILCDDIKYLADGATYSRRPFGIFPAVENSDPYWLQDTNLVHAYDLPGFKAENTHDGQDIWLGDKVKIAPGVALDTSKGPIILDNRVTVMPHCFLEGPLYVGPGSTIKAGATIYGESSFGIGNRIAGEIGESTFSDFANKQHDGFIGHAVLGAWTNLGAMTTCSDLKNNYGNVRMDLGSGTVDTGLRFVGLMLGDHVKTAIGTLFNTGTCVGFASNIFGGVMPPKFVCNFSWGGLPENPSYDVDKAIETASIVMSRRGCRLTDEGKKLIRFLA